MDIEAVKKQTSIPCESGAHCGCHYAARVAPAVLGSLEEAQARVLELGRGVAELLVERDEAQGKLDELERFTDDLHRRSGHPDDACLRCQFYDILRPIKEEATLEKGA